MRSSTVQLYNHGVSFTYHGRPTGQQMKRMLCTLRSTDRGTVSLCQTMSGSVSCVLRSEVLYLHHIFMSCLLFGAVSFRSELTTNYSYSILVTAHIPTAPCTCTPVPCMISFVHIERSSFFIIYSCFNCLLFGLGGPHFQAHFFILEC